MKLFNLLPFVILYSYGQIIEAQSTIYAAPIIHMIMSATAYFVVW